MAERGKSTIISVNRSVLLIIIAGVFAIGVFIGRGAWLFGTDDDAREELRSRMSSEEFQFIRPSILQDTAPELRKMRELQPFRYKVTALVDEQLEEEQAAAISVYFRDLDNGNWFGIRENEPFSPESQLKVPLMIAYFKWAEANPLVLRKKLLFTGQRSGPEPQILRPPAPLEPGRSYTVNDLVFRMVAYSDNDAYALLAANIPPEHLRKIYKDLYMNYDPSKGEDVLSLSAYASFFRVLFNTSYLSEEMSEKALRYLSRASFRRGMAAGVPGDIDVASKAGERVIPQGGSDPEGTMFQLHEFGIIYHPERPFLLGITVRGDDPETLARVIRDITRRVYTEVDRQSN
jgi:beta-lactamase class A